ncbi:MAG: hypothetical protein GW778_04705 [Alphaproteobacteria bacterium]|nr:hypothetical protein [Alphaproteobacteria bacterium]
MEYYEMLAGITISLFAAILGAIWRKADRAEKMAESNKVILTYLSRNLDKTSNLNERLSSLEASFGAEIKNLSISIKRMESALIRMDQIASCHPASRPS